MNPYETTYTCSSVVQYLLNCIKSVRILDPTDVYFHKQVPAVRNFSCIFWDIYSIPTKNDLPKMGPSDPWDISLSLIRFWGISQAYENII